MDEVKKTVITLVFNLVYVVNEEKLWLNMIRELGWKRGYTSALI